MAAGIGRCERAQLLYHVRGQRRHVQPQTSLAAEGVPLREGALDDLLGLGEHLLGEMQGRYRGDVGEI